MEVLIGFGGVLLGAALSWLSTRDATSREREHQEKELIRQRREEAAISLREQVDDLEAAMPQSGPGEAILDDLMAAGDLVEAARRRAALLRDDAVTGCLDALSFGLTVAILDAEEAGALRVNLWPLRFPFGDLRAALDAFLLREQAPEPLFPTFEEAKEIVGDDLIGMPHLHAEMRKRVRKTREQ